eukprot:15332847-Ditylum_brightwellii.AAC.1
MALDAIKSGLAEDNKDVELNCLMLECNKMAMSRNNYQIQNFKFKIFVITQQQVQYERSHGVTSSLSDQLGINGIQ